jgi:hypothetical protein
MQSTQMTICIANGSGVFMNIYKNPVFFFLKCLYVHIGAIYHTDYKVCHPCANISDKEQRVLQFARVAINLAPSLPWARNSATLSVAMVEQFSKTRGMTELILARTLFCRKVKRKFWIMNQIQRQPKIWKRKSNGND